MKIEKNMSITNVEWRTTFNVPKRLVFNRDWSYTSTSTNISEFHPFNPVNAAISIKKLTKLGQFTDKKQQELFEDKILPRITGFIGDSTEQEKRIKQLFRVKMLVEKAHQFIPAPSTISQHIHSLTWFELLDSIKRQDAFNSITDKKYVDILSVLSRTAKFLCITMAFSLADDVDYSKHFDNLDHHYSKEEIMTELNERLMEAALHYNEELLNEGENCLGNDEKQDKLFAKKVSTIKHFNNIWMVRHYLQLTSDIHFTTFLNNLLDPKTEKNYFNIRALVKLKNIFREKSALSEAMLEFVHRISLSDMKKKYGKIDGRFSILLFGANARKEFPSFDYDSYLIYDPGKETKSSGGLKGSLVVNDYYRKLGETIQKALLMMDMNLDLGHQKSYNELNFGNSDVESIIVGSLDEFRSALSNWGKDAFREIHSLLTMEHGVGDANLSKELQSMIRDLANQVDFLKSQSELILRRKGRLMENRTDNIKEGPGCLREFHELLWFEGLKTDFIPQILKNFFTDPYENQQIIIGYLFIMSMRIFFDFYYGRNDKTIPKDFDSFLTAYRIKPDNFKRIMSEHINNISRLTNKYYEDELKNRPELDKALKDLILEYKRNEEINFFLNENDNFRT